MTDDSTPKYYQRKTAGRREVVAWNPPATRAQQVYTHDVTCAHCGRHFIVASLMPIAPTYCSKEDNATCYKTRRNTYMKAYREGKKNAEEDKK